MDNKTFISAFNDFIKSKNIDISTASTMIKDVVLNMLKKKFNNEKVFDIILDSEKGYLEIWHNLEIVEDSEEDFDEAIQIRLSDAVKIEKDFKIGERVVKKINIEDFGRRIIQYGKQDLFHAIRSIEKNTLYDQYKEKNGDIIHGEIYQILSQEFLVLDNNMNELSLPKRETIFRKDKFKKGDRISAIVHKVDLSENNLRIILSRTSPKFLEKLIEKEVPEIQEQLVGIKEVVRIPGERSKVVVESYDDRIDPVGACVGIRGSRIKPIVSELGNENIDIINYSENEELFISRLISPAKVNKIDIDKEKDRIAIYLDKEEIFKAIGKNGQNIKLASRILNAEIDIF